MKKRSGTRIDLWGSPAETDLLDDVCPFRKTLWDEPDR